MSVRLEGQQALDRVLRSYDWERTNRDVSGSAVVIYNGDALALKAWRAQMEKQEGAEDMGWEQGMRQLSDEEIQEQRGLEFDGSRDIAVQHLVAAGFTTREALASVVRIKDKFMNGSFTGEMVNTVACAAATWLVKRAKANRRLLEASLNALEIRGELE